MSLISVVALLTLILKHLEYTAEAQMRNCSDHAESPRTNSQARAKIQRSLQLLAGFLHGALQRGLAGSAASRCSFPPGTSEWSRSTHTHTHSSIAAAEPPGDVFSILEWRMGGLAPSRIFIFRGRRRPEAEEDPGCGAHGA